MNTPKTIEQSNPAAASSDLLAALEMRFRRRARDLRAIGRGDNVAELMAAMYDGLAYDIHAELEAANDQGLGRRSQAPEST